MSVPRSSLVLGRELGKGGFGQVFAVSQHPLSDRRPLVFKQPRTDKTPSQITALLDGMRFAVDFRAGLTDDERRQLDEVSVWPVAMVTKRGRDVGCLLPLIPDRFFEDVGAQRQIRELAALARPDETRRNLGINDPAYDDDIIRMSVMVRLAGAIELLHSHGVVFGDLSPRNATLSFSPPSALLLDCDATASINDPHRAERQGHSPFWKPPEMEGASRSKDLQDLETDVYKLGLAFVRAFAPEPGATQRRTVPPQLPPVFTPELQRIIAAALDPDPSRRPTARQIHQAAHATVRDALAAPVFDDIRLSRPVVLRGQDVVVSWTVTAALPVDVLVTGPDGTEYPVPAGATSYGVRVDRAGAITLAARTKYASGASSAGIVDCYELPAFSVSVGSLTAPEIPALPAVEVPSVLRDDGVVALPSFAVSGVAVSDALRAMSDTSPALISLTEHITRAYAAMQAPREGASIIGAFASPAADVVRDLRVEVERILRAGGGGAGA